MSLAVLAVLFISMTTNSKTVKRRRWFQFSLRTLLILTTVFAAWMAWWSHQARQQRVAVAAIKQAHGIVVYDFENTDSSEPLAWQKPVITLLGVDYAANVDEVSFIGCQSRVHPRLELLKELSTLRRLNLCVTTVEDADLEHLAGLRSLEELAIDQSPITDAGVERLCKLRNLRFLGLGRTQLTEAGYRRLHQEMPNCIIDTKWRLF